MRRYLRNTSPSFETRRVRLLEAAEGEKVKENKHPSDAAASNSTACVGAGETKRVNTSPQTKRGCPSETARQPFWQLPSGPTSLPEALRLFADEH